MNEYEVAYKKEESNVISAESAVQTFKKR